MTRLVQRPRAPWFALLLLLSSSNCFLIAGAPDSAFSPKISIASKEADEAIRKFRIPEGFNVELFAAEPTIANPVAFCIDEKGRFYVVETFRLHAGVTDIRRHMDWLDDDLACRTVEDRDRLYRKHLGTDYGSYGTEHDRLRLIEDSDGDGKADKSTVFAEGFRNPVDGIAAGVLARKDKVWFTCIPDLWMLRDTNGDSKADEYKSLASGFGIHVGFLGHDLHGLKMGPDGKIYFSIGDRGLRVQTGGKLLDYPDTGAVLRCNPDGSNMEVFASGLRNPQELAFDQYGNLFTGDNNSDSGDKARWVYLVEGGDSGWRIGYQFHDMPTSRGPWNAEKLWHPQFDGQAAYIVPPITNLADGPSGLAYYPGVGLPDRYQGHFFLCDFRGGSGASGIRSFAVKPKGATFELVDSHEFLWSVLATDVDFGYDGKMYLTDWTEGWAMPTKGRIYKLFSPAHSKAPAVAQAKQIMAEGLERRSMPELAKLLAHPDMRIRQEAQFALAEKGATSVPTFVAVAKDASQGLARLHAIWGLGQIARTSPNSIGVAVELLRDPDAEVRAQAAKVLGEAKYAPAHHALVSHLTDGSSRVRFFAAMSLGKLGARESIGPLLALLHENNNKDAYLRHAAAMALSSIGNVEALAAVARHDSAAARMGAALALRRLKSPRIETFLNDKDPAVVLEAARAINDVPIVEAYPSLAKVLERSGLAEPLAYRALNANFRIGGKENAVAVAQFAARSDAPEAVRVEALTELAAWAKPWPRDRIVNLYRPLPDRAPEIAADAAGPVIGKLLHDRSSGVQRKACELAGQLGLKAAGDELAAVAKDAKLAGPVRAEAVIALGRLDIGQLSEVVRLATTDKDETVRQEGYRLAAKLEPEQAVKLLQRALSSGSVKERQGAFAVLREIKAESADRLIAHWLDQLVAGKAPAEISLDLLECAAGRSSAEVNAKLAAYKSSLTKDDPLAPYRETLAGGNAERGGKLFHEKAELSCVRCHKVDGKGGEVGPDLTKVAAEKKRDALLASIVLPNKEIAKGFDTVVLAMNDGQVHVGVLKFEDDRQIRLITPKAEFLTVAKADVDERTNGKSTMPEDLIKYLSKSELRDLIEYLAELK